MYYYKEEPEKSVFDIAIIWVQHHLPLIFFVFITILLFFYVVFLKRKIEVTKVALSATLLLVTSFIAFFATFSVSYSSYYFLCAVEALRSAVLLTEIVMFIYVLILFYRMKK